MAAATVKLRDVGLVPGQLFGYGRSDWTATAEPRDSIAAGSANPFDWSSGNAGLLRDKPVLFSQDCESGSIVFDAAKCGACNFAIGSP